MQNNRQKLLDWLGNSFTDRTSTKSVLFSRRCVGSDFSTASTEMIDEHSSIISGCFFAEIVRVSEESNPYSQLHSSTALYH